MVHGFTNFDQIEGEAPPVTGAGPSIDLSTSANIEPFDPAHWAIVATLNKWLTAENPNATHSHYDQSTEYIEAAL
jgi:hypothetical protein